MGCVFVVYFRSPCGLEATKGPHSGARARVAHTPPVAHGVPHNTTRRQRDTRPTPRRKHTNSERTARATSAPTNKASTRARPSADQAAYEPLTARRGACAKRGMVRATRRTPKDTKKLPASDERPRSRANMATCNCAAVKTCSVRGARKKTRVRYWMGGLRVARRANFTHTHVDKKIAQLHN